MPNDFQCKAKGRYKLSRISFPLTTLQRTPAATVLILRFKTNFCDDKSAIYFTLLKL